MPALSRPRGFTLIEVIVALFVVALGMGALLATLTSSADTMAHLRDRSFAQWIALNRISEVRLSASRPGVGVSEGRIDYAGASWRWRQEVSSPGIAGMLRIDVLVAPAGNETGNGDGEDGGNFPALGSATGFLGSSVAPPDGLSPDWSFASVQPPGSSGGDDDPQAPAPLLQRQP